MVSCLQKRPEQSDPFLVVLFARPWQTLAFVANNVKDTATDTSTFAMHNEVTGFGRPNMSHLDVMFYNWDENKT